VTVVRRTDVVVAIAVVAAAFAGGFGLYPFYDDWMYLSAAGDALASGRGAEFVWQPFFPHWSPISFSFELLSVAA
jgi:hypothetical protein